MVILQAGNPLGADIQTGEIENGAVTAAKMGTCWKLHSSGVTSAAGDFTISGLPEKKTWRLILHMNTASAASTIGMQLNADTGNNYNYHRLVDATVTFTANTSQIAGGYAELNDNIFITFEFNGAHGSVCKGSVKQIGYSGSQWLTEQAFQYNSSAVISAIKILANGAMTLTGEWALYYNEDIEVAT